MPEVVLNRARVLSVVGELEPRSMTQHMWMHREGQPGCLPGTRHNLSHRRVGERPAPLGDEYIRAGGVVAAQSPQGSQLRPAQRMRARAAILAPAHEQQTRFEIDLIPA